VGRILTAIFRGATGIGTEWRASDIFKRLTLLALSHTMPHVTILRFQHPYEGVLPK
jgi:hypothetical protein